MSYRVSHPTTSPGCCRAMITMASLGASEFCPSGHHHFAVQNSVQLICIDLSGFRVPKPEDAEIKNSTANCKAGVGVQGCSTSQFSSMVFNNLLTFVE